jgi:hypothetical protein
LFLPILANRNLDTRKTSIIKEGKINAWKLYKTHNNQDQKKQYPGFDDAAAIIVNGRF